MKYFPRFVAAAVLGWSLLCAPVSAHHSIAGAYDTGHEVPVEGTIAEFAFVNPHPYVVLSVETGGGEALWRLEMDNRGELLREGMRRYTLQSGDRVRVRGNPSRTQPQQLYIRSLERPADGFAYEQVGTRPVIRSATPAP